MNLAMPMRILTPLCIVFVLLSVMCFPAKNSLGFYLSLASLCLILFTMIITLTIELPIVNQVTQWNAETAPANWETLRDKWLWFHYLRVFPGLLSFALLLIAVLTEKG